MVQTSLFSLFLILLCQQAGYYCICNISGAWLEVWVMGTSPYAAKLKYLKINEHGKDCIHMILVQFENSIELLWSGLPYINMKCHTISQHKLETAKFESW